MALYGNEPIIKTLKYHDEEWDETQLGLAIQRSISSENDWIWLHTNVEKTIQWLISDGWEIQENGRWTFKAEDGGYKILQLSYDENLSPLLKASLISTLDDVSDENLDLIGKAVDRKNVTDSDEQYRLGLNYLHGNGTARDYEEAFYMIEKSANKGNRDAEYTLGIIYKDGELIERDNNKAVYWLLKSAKQDCSDAQYAIGTMYFRGNGVTRSSKHALYWFNKSAVQGNKNALDVLEQLS